MPKNNNNQTPEQDKLDLAQQAIKKGERSRILFEMLLAEIGLGFENTYKEVWEELHKVQQEYESAIKDLSMMIKVANTTKRHLKNEGVS